MKKILPILLCLSMLGVTHGQTSESLSTKTFTINPQSALSGVPSASVHSTMAGTASYYYWIVSRISAGQRGPNGNTPTSDLSSAPIGPFIVNNSVSVLGSKGYNVISWALDSGANKYDVLRTNSTTAPSGACACAVAINLAGSSVLDKANTLLSYTVATNGVGFVTTNEILGGKQNLVTRYKGAVVYRADGLGNLIFASGLTIPKVTITGNPTNPSDAATVGFVDALLSGGGKIYNGNGNPSSMQVTPVQSLDASGYDNFVISMATVTIGHTLIVATSATGACTVPTDTQNNVYSLAGTFGTYADITNVYFASILSSGADVISSHCSGTYQMFAASEIPTALLVDASGGAVSENLGLLSAIVTPTRGGDFIYTAVTSGSGINNQYPGAGQTALTNTWGPMGSLTEWTIAPTAGAFTSSVTVSSVNENMAVVAFYSTNPTIGNDGDFYFDSAAGTFYGPKAGGAWPALTIHPNPKSIASLQTCNSNSAGAQFPVTNSNTNSVGQYLSNMTPGEFVAVLECDGTGWYVLGAGAFHTE